MTQDVLINILKGMVMQFMHSR